MASSLALSLSALRPISSASALGSSEESAALNFSTASEGASNEGECPAAANASIRVRSWAKLGGAPIKPEIDAARMAPRPADWKKLLIVMLLLDRISACHRRDRRRHHDRRRPWGQVCDRHPCGPPPRDHRRLNEPDGRHHCAERSPCFALHAVKHRLGSCRTIRCRAPTCLRVYRLFLRVCRCQRGVRHWKACSLS